MEKISANKLRELFIYDPETGHFRRRTKNGNRQNRWHLDVPVGTKRPDGYIQISISYRLYMAHRLAWLWMTGEWPHPQIDHKDHNRANNRWDNLRQATPTQNHANKSMQSNNKSGFKGVCKPTDSKKWWACIQINGKNRQIGQYDTAEEAHLAYQREAVIEFGEFAFAARANG